MRRPLSLDLCREPFIDSLSPERTFSILGLFGLQTHTFLILPRRQSFFLRAGHTKTLIRVNDLSL